MVSCNYSVKVEVMTVMQFKVIVEKHSDGYVAYPPGLKGVVVGEGDTYEEALVDVKSAIKFHMILLETRFSRKIHPFWKPLWLKPVYLSNEFLKAYSEF
jgi:predicted RNase H-like HicB family nuclease